MEARYRAFVGIALPESYQQALGAIRDRLRPLTPAPLAWTRPGNWHLTLQFLGDVPLVGPSGLEAVTAALAGIRFASFPLAAAGGGFFPQSKRPRVAWVGLHTGEADCRLLAAAVGRALAPVGYPPEDRPFAAHLTLGRIRDPSRASDWQAVERELAAVHLPETRVSALTLWRSVLQPGGPRYEVLATFPAEAAFSRLTI